MSGKNSYLERLNEERKAVFHAGLETGRQQMLDFFVILLNDAEYMGKDTFGAKRLVKCVDGIKKLMEEYDAAFQRDPEADYWQEVMDAKLAKAFGVEKLKSPFAERYQYASRFDYEKGKWK